MATDHNIKRGVSLYSFQSDYYLRRLTLEQLIAHSKEMGIPGIEIIGDQMIPGYPDIPAEFLHTWNAWRDHYGFTPVCLDMFLDWNKFDGRDMTDQEMVDSFKQDILNANKLGCSVIRVIHNIPHAILEKAVPTAEKYNVKLAVEVHAPHHLDSPIEQQLIRMFQRLQSPCLGFTIDMGVFTRKLPRVALQSFVDAGMKQSIADYLAEGYEFKTLPPGEHSQELTDKVLQMGGSEQDVYNAHLGIRMIFMNPQRLSDYMPYILHCHGKFWEMLPEYREYSIPYEEIIPVLIQGGYNGYIDSEYEGALWTADAGKVESLEQVRRHQVMLKRLLGES